MKPTKYIPAIFAVAVLLLIFKSFFDQYVPNYDFKNWQHGAAGYRLALKEAKEKDSPLIIYFHTSWCGWCEKLDRNYLANGEMEKFLSSIPKVEINPDKGKEENDIFNEFGLTGFPSFLVLTPKSNRGPVLLSPFLSSGALTVEEFIHKIRRAM